MADKVPSWHICGTQSDGASLEQTEHARSDLAALVLHFDEQPQFFYDLTLQLENYTNVLTRARLSHGT